jgi:carboxyl-terminal processing protease
MIKHLFPSVALFLVLSGAAIAPSQAQAAADTVTRQGFILSAVEALFGDVKQQYPVGLRGVSVRAKNSIGLASAFGALQGWEQSTDWNAPVTRGQAIRVLFTLATLSPDTPSYAPFRDVEGSDVPLVDQAQTWEMFAPLTPTYFGFNRSLSPAELSTALARFKEHLALPLKAPPVPTTTSPRIPKKIIIEAPGNAGSKMTAKQLPRSDLLSAIWGLVQAKYLYLDKVDQQELGYSLAEKLMSFLDDPYTTFMRPSGTQAFQEHLRGGKLSGIGAQVEKHPNGGVLVVSPLTGSPALKAGVRSGDRITHVDGVSVIELDLQQGVEKIRGPAGTTVELTIERNGATISIKVVRAEITLPEIEISMQDGVAVVKLYQFGERSIRDLRGALEETLKQKPTGLILDVRNNPGGLLDAALSVLSNFLPDGSTAAKIESKSSTKDEKTEGTPVLPADLPMVVIVNKGSASASEIVAGALQDYKRATILGEQTFGKGTVQEVVQFNTGESVKFTTARWLRPLGASIEKIGVTPDIKMTEGQEGSRDEFLLAAVKNVREKMRK